MPRCIMTHAAPKWSGGTRSQGLTGIVSKIGGHARVSWRVDKLSLRVVWSRALHNQTGKRVSYELNVLFSTQKMSYYKGSRRRSRKRSNLGSGTLGVSNVNSSETSYVSLKIHNSTALSQYTMPQYYRKKYFKQSQHRPSVLRWNYRKAKSEDRGFDCLGGLTNCNYPKLVTKTSNVLIYPPGSRS